MNWLGKTAAQSILSPRIGAAAWNWSTQERIAKSLLTTCERVSQEIDVGLKVLQPADDNHGLREHLIQRVHWDSGAGWHPPIPLLYFARPGECAL